LAYKILKTLCEAASDFCMGLQEISIILFEHS